MSGKADLGGAACGGASSTASHGDEAMKERGRKEITSDD